MEDEKEEIICPKCSGNMVLNRKEEQYECEKCGVGGLNGMEL